MELIMEYYSVNYLHSPIASSKNLFKKSLHIQIGITTLNYKELFRYD